VGFVLAIDSDFHVQKRGRCLGFGQKTPYQGCFHPCLAYTYSPHMFLRTLSYTTLENVGKKKERKERKKEKLKIALSPDTVAGSYCAFFPESTGVAPPRGALYIQSPINMIHPTTVPHTPAIHTHPPLIAQLRGHSSCAKCLTVTVLFSSTLVKKGRL
jgi:hypothetical protein